MYLTLMADLGEQEQFAALVERHERLRATQREALRQAEHFPDPAASGLQPGVLT